MFKHPFKTLAITAALAAALSSSALAASIGGAEVTAETLSLQSAPSANASAITTAPQGSLVVVGEKVGSDWYRVVYRGAVGYMSSEHLSYQDNLYGSFGFGLLRGSEVSLYSAPAFSAQSLGSFGEGTYVTITGVSGSWYKARVGALEGYIHSDSVALNGGVPDDFAGIAAGRKIVDTAMKYLSVPYVWGGTSAYGFDCSGLVYYVYKECGYSINRTAASIYENGYGIEKSSLRQGDAICFSSSRSAIGHVGIYIGDGQFIHASSGSGRVIISALDESYYERHYVGARRLV